MTNKEIRAIAREKRKTARGLVPVALLFFGVTLALEIPLMVARNRGTGIYAELAYYVALLLFMGLVGGAGIARVSISAWNTGVARPGELFSSLTDGRRFLRALAPVLIVVAVSLGWLYMSLRAYGPYTADALDTWLNSIEEGERVVVEFSPLTYAMPLAGLALMFVSMVITQLYYAIHLWPDVPVGEVLRRGGKRAAGAIGRVLCMDIAIIWKPFLVCVGAIIVGSIIGAFMGRVALTVLLILLTLGMLYYILVRLTPYMMLAFAGLEIDVFSEKVEEAE